MLGCSVRPAAPGGSGGHGEVGAGPPTPAAGVCGEKERSTRHPGIRAASFVNQPPALFPCSQAQVFLRGGSFSSLKKSGERWEGEWGREKRSGRKERVINPRGLIKPRCRV